MAQRKVKEPRGERSSAVVIAFPIIARRELSAAARLPFEVVPVRHTEPVVSDACPRPANENDRPALPPAKRGWLWETALAASIAVHAALGFALWERNNYDLERAAGAAAAADEGTVVIPIEVVVSAALPSAEKPVETTTPEETQITQTAPEPEEKTEKQEEKQEEEKVTAPPPKSDDAAEAVKEAKESPKPEKEKKEKKEQKKKETKAASRTAAANPSRAAGARAQGRAGAGGRGQYGGHADTSSYQAQVLAHLQRYRSYPAAAKSAGIRGTAVVRFSLSASGSVLSASLVRGSGAPVLDQAAVEMVRRASPFPPIPPNLGRSRMDFAAPIRFDLQ